jgi:hypothetical protein
VEVTQFPPDRAETYSINCLSRQFRRAECALRGPGTARLSRQTSNTRCEENLNWGVDAAKLWVDKGCGGSFTVTPGPAWEAYTFNRESARNKCQECRLKGEAEAVRGGLEVVSARIVEVDSRHVHVELVGKRRNVNVDLYCRYDSAGRTARILRRLNSMSTRALPLSILVCLAAACSATQPAAQVDEPRQVSLAESSECRNLGLIVKRSARHSKQSFNTNQAMKDAMDAVLASGADSYQLLDVDDEGHGTQVIMQAFACP